MQRIIGELSKLSGSYGVAQQVVTEVIPHFFCSGVCHLSEAKDINHICVAVTPFLQTG